MMIMNMMAMIMMFITIMMMAMMMIMMAMMAMMMMMMMMIYRQQWKLRTHMQSQKTTAKPPPPIIAREWYERTSSLQHKPCGATRSAPTASAKWDLWVGLHTTCHAARQIGM